MADYGNFDGIEFIQMGGTIDKHYPAHPTNHGYNFEIGRPAFRRILERVARFPWETLDAWSAAQKDSLDITDADRHRVRQHIITENSKKVIITHGTDTIRKTAEALAELSTNRTIVLTGALQPELFRESDADFNLGMAIAAVKGYPHGVYIALYCEVTRWDEFIPRQT